MPFSCFSLSLSAAFVFLSALYFVPHYPVAEQSIGGGGGKGRSSGPCDKGGGLKTNSVWSKNKGGHGPPGSSPGSATAIGTSVKGYGYW